MRHGTIAIAFAGLLACACGGSGGGDGGAGSAADQVDMSGLLGCNGLVQCLDTCHEEACIHACDAQATQHARQLELDYGHCIGEVCVGTTDTAPGPCSSYPGGPDCAACFANVDKPLDSSCNDVRWCGRCDSQHAACLADAP